MDSMALCLKAVLDRQGHDSSGALSQTTIKLSMFESMRRLLESVGILDDFHLEVLRAATSQYVSVGSTAPAIVEISIGILDWRNNLARVIHTISTSRQEGLVSASAALMRLRPLSSDDADATGNDIALSRMPSWSDGWRSEVALLLQSVPLPANDTYDGPVTWDYWAIIN